MITEEKQKKGEKEDCIRNLGKTNLWKMLVQVYNKCNCDYFCNYFSCKCILSIVIYVHYTVNSRKDRFMIDS